MDCASAFEIDAAAAGGRGRDRQIAAGRGDALRPAARPAGPAASVGTAVGDLRPGTARCGLADHARTSSTPDKPGAMIAGRKRRGADLCRVEERPVEPAGAISLCAGPQARRPCCDPDGEQHPLHGSSCWAALRSGLYFTAINRYLPADEAAYVVEDCGYPGAGHVPGHAGGGRAAHCRHDPRLPGAAHGRWGDPWLGSPTRPRSASVPAQPLAEEFLGEAMLYSSGTTGRPKGVLKPLSDATPAEAGETTKKPFRRPTGSRRTWSIFSPAPLYHAAEHLGVSPPSSSAGPRW